eukprot:3463194-Pleurochrysis_carterae.AAC.1
MHNHSHELIHLDAAHTTPTAPLSWLQARDARFPGAAGTVFFDPNLASAMRKGVLPRSLVDKYSVIVMAGIAAEAEANGRAEGGRADEEALLRLLASLDSELPHHTRTRTRMHVRTRTHASTHSMWPCGQASKFCCSRSSSERASRHVLYLNIVSTSPCRRELVGPRARAQPGAVGCELCSFADPRAPRQLQRALRPSGLRRLHRQVHCRNRGQPAAHAAVQG